MNLLKVSEIETGLLIALVMGIVGATGRTWIDTEGVKKMEFFEFLVVFLRHMPEGFIFGVFSAAVILLFTGPLRRKHPKEEEEEEKEDA
jgi:hypothetical protein